MATINEIKDLALSCGFSHVGELDADTIELRTEIRAACAENKCHAYNTNWACPPGCGTLEECAQRIRQYHRGLILQTTGELEDSFDFEGMADLAKRHKEIYADFAEKLKEIVPDALLITDGACTRCKTCTYPDAPCRFPDKMTSSMEALGMVVSDVCKSNDMKYYYGPGTLTYVGCVLTE